MCWHATHVYVCRMSTIANGLNNVRAKRSSSTHQNTNGCSFFWMIRNRRTFFKRTTRTCWMLRGLTFAEPQCIIELPDSALFLKELLVVSTFNLYLRRKLHVAILSWYLCFYNTWAAKESQQYRIMQRNYRTDLTVRLKNYKIYVLWENWKCVNLQRVSDFYKSVTSSRVVRLFITVERGSNYWWQTCSGDR